MSSAYENHRRRQQEKAYQEWQAKRAADEKKAIAAEGQAHPVSLPEPADVDADVEEARRRNREKYPELAKWVDEIRKHFPDAKVVSIKEYTPEQVAERKRK